MTRIQVDPTTAQREAVVHLVSIYSVYQTLVFCCLGALPVVRPSYWTYRTGDGEDDGDYR